MMAQKPYEEGSVLMDAEEHFEYDKLSCLQWKNSPELAENREQWNLEVNTIKYGSIGDVIIRQWLGLGLADIGVQGLFKIETRPAWLANWL